MADKSYNYIKKIITSAILISFFYSCGDRIINPIEELLEDPPGVTVLAGSSNIVSESGTTGSFEIVLTGPPSDDVSISVSTSDNTEGTIISPFTGDTGIITFTPANWNIKQTIIVQGVNDPDPDGNQPFTIILGVTTSADPMYKNAFDPGDVAFTNIDDEIPGVTVIAGSSKLVSESGTTSSFEVVLNSQPTTNVDINVSTGDSTEGTISFPFAGNSGTITFTSLNWNVPQTVTIQGIDDPDADGNQAFTIVLGTTASADPFYNGTYDPADVNFMNVDDDAPGITVNVWDGVITKEHPATPLSDTFQVVLNSRPTGNVDIPLTVTNAGEGIITAPFAGTAGILTFTTANWNIPQTVTVQGVDDALVDGMQTYTITLGAAVSSDTLYAGIDPGDITVYNLDNESGGSVVIRLIDEAVTSESGTSARFEVFLSSQPAANVVLGGNGNIQSTDSSEGTITFPFAGAGTLTFTPTNWNTPQQIVVTGSVDDGDTLDATYDIDFGYITSPDPYWDGMYGGTLQFTNLDDVVYAFPYSTTGPFPGPSFVSIKTTGKAIYFKEADPGTYTRNDEGYEIIPIGFHFNYIDTHYNRIVVYTNGFASFDTGIVPNTYDNTYLFTSNLPLLVLAPWWDDLYLDTALYDSYVYYETQGSSPNRVLVIEWHNAFVVGDDEAFSFQLKLFEGSDMIEFVYNNRIDDAYGNIGDSTSASCGIKDNTGGLDNTFVEGISSNTMLPGTSNYLRTDFPAPDTIIRFTHP